MRQTTGTRKSHGEKIVRRPGAGLTIELKTRTNHFNQERHLYSRKNFKNKRSAALAEWHLIAA